MSNCHISPLTWLFPKKCLAPPPNCPAEPRGPMPLEFAFSEPLPIGLVALLKPFHWLPCLVPIRVVVRIYAISIL